MIEINNVVKNYGSRQVLKGISFKVEDGQIAGLLGSNGAGKSTTMNILAGCLSSTEGEVFIQGFDILTQPMESRRQIGYLPETPPLYDDMTVEEYLDFAGKLKGVKSREERKSALQDVMAKTGISDVAGRLIDNLSKGYRQRVGLAQALMGNPPVLILDEPMAGLDPEQTVEIRNLIQSLGGEHTIILSSHFLSEIQAICDKMIIMVDGGIAFDDEADRLINRYVEEGCYRLTVKAGQDALMKVLNKASFVEEFQLERQPAQLEKKIAAETEKEAAKPEKEAAEVKQEAAEAEEKTDAETEKEAAKPEKEAAEVKQGAAEAEEKTDAEMEKEAAKPEKEAAEVKQGAAETEEKTDAETEKEAAKPEKEKSAGKKKKEKGSREENLSADEESICFTLKLKSGDKSLDQLFYLLARKKMPILHMESVKMSLEDIFVQLIREYRENRREEEQE